MDSNEMSCTWKDAEQCTNCVNLNRLNCKWKMSDLLLFVACAMPAMIGCLTGTILIWIVQASWWPTLAYILFFPVMLGVAESRFLCSHCPYYAQKGFVLHCLANHGILKMWKYHPEPMNKLEKSFMVLLGVLFLLLLPGTIFGYNIWLFSVNSMQYGIAALIAVIGLSVVTMGSLLALAFVMVKYICALCINFSCPFNQVDKNRRDAYLQKNEVMRNAWEKSGYQLGPFTQEKE